MRRKKLKRRHRQHEPELHKSVIMWRGEIFTFVEPVNENDLLHFFTTIQDKQGQLPRCDIGEVDTFFHGAGDCPINNAVRMCEESKTNNKIYYFPNNEMGKPYGWYDAMVSKIVPYPSKENAQKNGYYAGNTLYTLCRYAHKIQNCDILKPHFNSVSAGVNTMWHGINVFLDKISHNSALLAQTSIARKQIFMSQIPTAGYKGASPEDTAKLVCQAEDKISKIQTDAGYRHINEDRYRFTVCDDYVFKVLRLHHVENTRKFLQYFNDNNKSIPLHILRHINSPNAGAEKDLFDDITHNKYSHLKDITLHVFNERGYAVDGADNSLLGEDDRRPDGSCSLLQNTGLIKKIGHKHFGSKNNDEKPSNMHNGNVSFDLKNAYTQQTQEGQEKC